MKNSSWGAMAAAIVGIGCLGALNEGSASAETLSIQGSPGFADEMMEPYQDRIEALTGHKLNVTSTATGAGLLALLKGETDLAMISGPLDSMVAPLRKSRPDLPIDLLREFRVAQSQVAYTVNPGNPVRSVSLAKLKQVLNGQIGNWRELGGPDLPIDVVSLRNGGGSKRATRETLFGAERMTPRSDMIVESDKDVVQAVAQNRGALGICRASMAKLHRLPELQTKVSIERSFSLVSLNEPTAAMRAVIAATRSVAFDQEP
jgi:phosphate transport system substrate-binding protein